MIRKPFWTITKISVSFSFYTANIQASLSYLLCSISILRYCYPLKDFTLKRTRILFCEKMGSTENCLCWNKNRHLVSSLLLALLFSSLTQVRFMAEGTSYTTHRETLLLFFGLNWTFANFYLLQVEVFPS